ncbi:kinase-like domain-containing protein [Rhizophagus clarus]|uniref:Kinase-like domain-containing protein n=1 Tax=Rhizophagus clarus TaxID=94130 RepID=A0A8H3R430_9GLOM|nr:kinase-like domain-containing protein [Rhizophagus clarus]
MDYFFIKSIRKLIKLLHVNKTCEKCNFTCNAIHFQHNFENWTSGNEDIDKFIQDTQLSAHDNVKEALEWIPYDRLYDIKYIAEKEFDKVYSANWIDGNISLWDDENQNWKRINHMFVILKSLNNPKNITMEFSQFTYENTNKPCGITQDPETKNYINWTSGNNNIDKFIQDDQLSTHDNYNIDDALEWIPYNRFHDIKYIAKEEFSKVYRASWIDGNIDCWDDENKNWKRINHNMFVILRSLNNPKNISTKLKNECIAVGEFGKVYRANWIDGNIGFWDDVNKNWKRINHNTFVILKSLNGSRNISLKFKNEVEWIPYNRLHNIKCVAKEKFGKVYGASWIDGNIDFWDDGNKKWKRINYNMFVILKSLNNPENILMKFKNKDTQLSAHDNAEAALEWIPYDKFYNVKYIANEGFDEVYRANWIDGSITFWDDESQNWQRINSNMFVILKSLNDSINIYISVKFANESTNKPYTQLSAHYNMKSALEWIPYSRLHNIKCIAKEKLSEMYRANWIDGNISNWDDENQNWERIRHNTVVILKSLNDLESIAIEFANEINKPYGITQDLETKNYMMVLSNICKVCNCKCNAIHFQQNFENWTSGDSNINKFIRDTQLLAHDNYNIDDALEWIPYDRFYNIKYIAEEEEFSKVYSANWVDGNISFWDDENQNWERINHNMFVILKSLNNLKNISMKFKNKCITKKFDEEYRANWIDGNINFWDNENQNWERMNHNMVVILKRLNNPKNISMEFTYEVNKFYGITQNPETEDYMVVLDDVCEKCNYICSAKTFHRNFRYWTSGNNDIDKIIQNTQLSIHDNYEIFKKALEWIPYDRFCNIKYIAQGGFGKIYIANWIDGYLNNWNYGNKTWNRYNKNMLVALKSLDNSKNATSEFINEIMLHNKGKKDNNFIIGFYGITQNPETKNYTMVLDYAEGGSLRSYLNEKHSELNWNEKICCLQNAIFGLEFIHEKELIHRDLHIGNILKLKYKTVITDMGLCKPANYNASENAKNTIFGVLPYIAPEVLKGKKYTKAADIYSFGIIMYEVISGLPPYHDLSHDEYLAIKICHGLRPTFKIKVPQLIVRLIKRCLDADPLIRPTAKEINDILRKWRSQPNDDQTAELQAQIKETDEINNNSSNSNITSANLGISYETHPQAIYTSRLLNFNILPEPKNSDDYYEQNDNIISKKFSECIQFDTSQWNNIN